MWHMIFWDGILAVNLFRRYPQGERVALIFKINYTYQYIIG